jgi:Fe-S-cluster containining protein
MDFKPFFLKYESLVSVAETMFDKVQNEFSENVRCEPGCSDCCFALFDLTLIEAIYLNHHFNEKFSGVEKLDLIDRANRADRRTYKIKREAHKEFLDGASELDIIGRMSLERVRCALLNEDDMCDLYENRPITCRLYGIPTSSSGTSHTCGKSGFLEGNKYPTVNMDQVYKQLYQLSGELVSAAKSKNHKMGDMLVPVSMALLNDYNEALLGVKDEPSHDENAGEKNG